MLDILTKEFKWERKRPQFWLLLDPDNTQNTAELAHHAEENLVDAILVGSSILVESPIEETIEAVKSSSNLPVLIFPGGREQLSASADALLFLNFLSSRNTRWLVEEQVIASPMIKKLDIPVIPTGYLLVESGSLTSVGFFAGTPPIPRNKPDIAVAHALAAQYMGMRAVFLEAGSGAQNPVPNQMLEAVREKLDIFLIAGGGLRTPEQAAQSAKFADAVVIGNHFEVKDNWDEIAAFADAIHDE